MSEQPRDKGLAELDRQEATGSPGPLHPKDRVRVTFESNYEDVEIAMWHNRPLMSIATVEVLERADDPSLNDLGTPRLEAHDDDPGHSVWLCTQDRHGKRGWFCVYSTAVGNQGGRMEDDEVAGLPVVGALIATPAAEAEKPAPSSSHESHCKDLAEAIYASHIYPWEELLFTARRYATHAIRDERAAENEEDPEVSGAGVPYPPTDPLTMEQRQRLSALLVDGRKADAVALAAAIGMPHDKALTYVESMPEYQTGENHRPVDDVPLPTVGLRMFKNQHNTMFRVHPDGCVQVLVGATWCGANKTLHDLIEDQYVREIPEVV